MFALSCRSVGIAAAIAVIWTGALGSFAAAQTSDGEAVAPKAAAKKSTTAKSSTKSAASTNSKLTACRDASIAASKSGDPTEFACDWRAIMASAPGAALTGKFSFGKAGHNGAMTIIETGGPALIAITTVQRASAHTCALHVTGKRGDDDVLVAKSEIDEACTLKLVSTAKKNVVSVTAENCQSLCGVRASFDGEYSLKR